MANVKHDLVIDSGEPIRHPLRGLLVAQFFGAFNDNAWKQFVALLAIAAVTSDQGAQGAAAMAQVALMVPLMLVSLLAGVLADRMSKRSVILAMKCLELSVMIAGTMALYVHPSGGWPALAVLCLLGVQSAQISPEVRHPPGNPAAREAFPSGHELEGEVELTGRAGRSSAGG